MLIKGLFLDTVKLWKFYELGYVSIEMTKGIICHSDTLYLWKALILIKLQGYT